MWLFVGFLLAILGLAWSFGARAIRFLAPVIAQTMGCSLKVDTLSLSKIAGVKVQLPKGKLRSLEVDAVDIQLHGGVIGSILAFLAGKATGHIAVRGVRVILHVAASAKGNSRSRPPQQAADDLAAHTAAAAKTAGKLSRLLHKLFTVSLDVDAAQVVVQPSGLVLSLPGLSWQLAADAAGEAVSGWALAVRNPSVSLLPAVNMAGDSSLQLVSCPGLSVHLVPNASRSNKAAVLSAAAVMLGQVDVNLPLPQLTQLLQHATPMTDQQVRADTTPAVAVAPTTADAASAATTAAAGPGKGAGKQRRKVAAAQRSLQLLSSLVGRATLGVQGISIRAATDGWPTGSDSGSSQHAVCLQAIVGPVELCCEAEASKRSSGAGRISSSSVSARESAAGQGSITPGDAMFAAAVHSAGTSRTDPAGGGTPYNLSATVNDITANVSVGPRPQQRVEVVGMILPSVSLTSQWCAHKGPTSELFGTVSVAVGGGSAVVDQSSLPVLVTVLRKQAQVLKVPRAAAAPQGRVFTAMLAASGAQAAPAPAHASSQPPSPCRLVVEVATTANMQLSLQPSPGEQSGHVLTLAPSNLSLSSTVQSIPATSPEQASSPAVHAPDLPAQPTSAAITQGTETQAAPVLLRQSNQQEYPRVKPLVAQVPAQADLPLEAPATPATAVGGVGATAVGVGPGDSAPTVTAGAQPGEPPETGQPAAGPGPVVESEGTPDMVAGPTEQPPPQDPAVTEASGESQASAGAPQPQAPPTAPDAATAAPPPPHRVTAVAHSVEEEHQVSVSLGEFTWQVTRSDAGAPAAPAQDREAAAQPAGAATAPPPQGPQDTLLCVERVYLTVLMVLYPAGGTASMPKQSSLRAASKHAHAAGSPGSPFTGVHASVRVITPQVRVTQHTVGALLHTMQRVVAMEQSLRSAGATEARTAKKSGRGKRSAAWPLHQVDVTVEDLGVEVEHDVPVVEAFSDIRDGGTPFAASQPLTTPAEDVASSATVEEPCVGSIQQLTGSHRLQVSGVKACLAPQIQRSMVAVTGVQLSQRLPRECKPLRRTVGAAGGEGAAPASGTAGSTRQPDSNPAPVVAVPLVLEQVELRGQVSQGKGKLLRSNVDSLRVAVEFDTVLMAMGLVSTLAQHAAAAKSIAAARTAAKPNSDSAPVATAAAAQGDIDPRGVGAGGPERRKQGMVVEVRVVGLDAQARVGERDIVQVTADLVRGSTQLQEAVLNDVRLAINQKDVINARYVSCCKPQPLPGAVAPSGSSTGAAAAAGGEDNTAPDAPSPGDSAVSGGPQVRAGNTPGGQDPPSVEGGAGQGSGGRGRHSRSGSGDSVDLQIHSSPSGTGLAGATVTVWEKALRSGQVLLGPDSLYDATTTLGNRRNQILAESTATPPQTVQTRREAARERYGLLQRPLTSSPPSVPATAAAGAPSARPAAAPADAVYRLVELDLVVESALVCFPHDESPMRVFVLTETWAKAVKQVLQPLLAQLKADLALLKSPKKPASSNTAVSDGSSPLLAKGPWPLVDKYIEIVLEAKKLAFAIDQHPMEAWMSLHQAALRQTAAERQLWERLLASLPTPRPSANDIPATRGDAGPEAGGDSDSGGSVSSDEDPYLGVAGGASWDRQGNITLSSSGLGQQAGGAGVLGPSGAGKAEAVPPGRPAAPLSPWEQMLRNITSAYVATCRELQSQRRRGRPSAGSALLHASASHGGAVIMVCKPGVAARAHAAAAIAQLDSATQGLALERIAPLSLDATLHDVAVTMSGARAPLLTAGSLSVSGMLIRARQLTATPRTRELHFTVGRLHRATVLAPVKGCRAPMKSYTNLKVKGEDVEVCGGLGLEPCMGQLAKAFKQRVIPPDFINADGTVPAGASGSAGIAPWDKMRYVWRGQLKVKFQNLRASLAADLSVMPGPADPCLQLTASTFGVTVSTGRLDVASTSLSVVSYMIPPEGSPGDPLLSVPFCHLPLLTAALHTTWVMPGGADALQHHIFPLRYELPQPGEVQEPLDVASLIKSEGVVLGVDLSLNADYTVAGHRQAAGSTGNPAGGATHPPAPSPALPPSGPHHHRSSGSGHVPAPLKHFSNTWQCLAPSPTPRAYLGELQVAFIRKLATLFATAPPFYRNSIKKRTFYEQRANPGAQITSPRPDGSDPPLTPGVLVTRVDIRALADVLEVHHDAQDPEDLSDFVFLRAHNIKFNGNFSSTRTLGSVLRRGRPVPRWVRQPAGSSLSLDASHLGLVRPEDPNSVHSGAAAGDPSVRRRATANSSAGGRGAAGGSWEPEGCPVSSPGFGEGLICTASRLQLKLAPGSRSAVPAPRVPEGVPAKRPLRMVVQDVQLYGTAVLRDTCIATVMHMIAAFTRKPSPAPPPTRPGADPAGYGAPADTQKPSSLGAHSHVDPGGAESMRSVDSVSGVTAAEVHTVGFSRHSTVAAAPPVSSEAILQLETQLLNQLLEAREKRVAAAAADPSSAGDGHSPDPSSHRTPGDQSQHGASHSASAEGGSEGGDLEDSRVSASLGAALVPQGSASSVTASVGGGARGSLDEQESFCAGLTASPSSVSDEVLSFEMEFVRVQVAVVAVGCSGAFLFATNSARLSSLHTPATGARRLVTSFTHLQAYGIRQVGDAVARQVLVPWLTTHQGRLLAPSESAIASTVLNPFNLDIIHTRQTELSAASGDELTLQVPSVEGVLEPWQFETLVDIIQNVLICPPPQVSMLLPPSILNPAVEASSSVTAAKEVVHSLSQQLAALHREVLTVAPAVLTTLWAQQHNNAASGDWTDTSLSPHQVLSALMAPAGGLSAAARARQQSKEVLLVWCMDQVSGAGDSVEAGRALLSRERSKAELLVRTAAGSMGRRSERRGGPLSATVVLGHFNWTLSNRAGQAFVAAELEGLEYTSALDRNYIGTTRLVLRNIELRELATQPSAALMSAPLATGASPVPSATSATAPRTPRQILSLWQPGRADTALQGFASGAAPGVGIRTGAGAGADAVGGDLGPGGRRGAGWEHEFAVSMAAVHGGLEPPDFVVYDHLEVVVHPLQVHLTNALAHALQDYFMLDDQTPTSNTAAAAGGGMVGGAGSGLGPAGPPPLPPLPTSVHSTPSAAKVVGDREGSGQSGSPSKVPERLHRRGGSAHALTNPASGIPRQVVSSSVGGGLGTSSGPHNPDLTLPFTTRSRALTADNVTAGEPNRYGAVYRRRSRQLSGRGASGSVGGTGGVSGDDPRAAKGLGGQRRGLRKLQYAAAAGSRSRRGGSASSSAAPSMGGDGGGSLHGGPDAARALQSIPRSQHKYRFKHVRFNRMHAKVTFVGPPITFTDLKLVLDHSVYTNVEGAWKVLVNKYKWDVIRSIFKSVTGMQKGKVAELERGTNIAGGVGGGVGDSGRSGARGGVLRQNIRSLLGIGESKRSKSALASRGASEVDQETLLELIRAAELLRQKQARLALLLGTVPPAPTRKLLLEGV